jgi:hypothetical protein
VHESGQRAFASPHHTFQLGANFETSENSGGSRTFVGHSRFGSSLLSQRFARGSRVGQEPGWVVKFVARTHCSIFGPNLHKSYNNVICDLWIEAWKVWNAWVSKKQKIICAAHFLDDNWLRIFLNWVFKSKLVFAKNETNKAATIFEFFIYFFNYDV